jgi:S-DNA-T family DNA segregation ATPase FtsK/SpoIIIE
VRPFRLDSRGVPAGADGIVGSQGSAGGESDLARLTAQLVAAHPSPAAPIWLPPLPDSIDLAALRARTPPTPSAAEPGRAVLPVAVGLLDDPVRRRQPPLVLDPGRHSIAMVGGPQTGRSTFLRTLLHALCAGWPAHAVQAYVIDCAGGGHRPLLELPHVAGVAERTDAGAVTRLLDELGEVLVERASACSATGTTTLAGLCEHPGADDVLPHPLRARLVVLVDGAQMLRAEHPDEERRLTEMAATGGALGVRMVLTAARWFDLRPALLDTVGTRLELRLGEPADSQVGRARAALVRAVPGRGLTADGQSFQLAVPGPAPAVAPSPHRAPRLVTLPARITEREVDGLVARAGRAPDDDVTGHFLLGVAEARARVVRLDLLAPGAHLVVHGDPGSGRTTLLLRAVAWLAARRTDDSAPPVRLHVVDPQRSMARSPALRGVTSYAYDRAGAADLALALHDRLLARLPPPGLSPEDVLGHGWWSGPEEVLVVDDYDLLLGPDGSPLLPLAELLQQSADLGLHVLLARQVSGTVRTAYEPVGQRLRESAPTGLLLSGDRAEGPLIGDHAASRQPPGRGVLVRPGRPTALVQTCLPDT